MSDSNRVSVFLAQRVATATKLMFYTHILNDNPNGLLRALWHAFSNDRAGRRDRTRSSLRYGRRLTNVPQTFSDLRSDSPVYLPLYYGNYTGFYKGRQANTGPPFCKTVRLLFDSLLFDSGESPGYPHLRAGVSTTTMSSMVTSKMAANITKLSIVGMDVP